MNKAVFDLGAPEIIIIALVLLVLFGAKKLPEFARGTGRALRIFKSETKGLMDDDNAEQEPSPQLGTSTTQPPTVRSSTTPVSTTPASTTPASTTQPPTVHPAQAEPSTTEVSPDRPTVDPHPTDTDR